MSINTRDMDMKKEMKKIVAKFLKHVSFLFTNHCPAHPETDMQYSVRKVHVR